MADRGTRPWIAVWLLAWRKGEKKRKKRGGKKGKGSTKRASGSIPAVGLNSKMANPYYYSPNVNFPPPSREKKKKKKKRRERGEKKKERNRREGPNNGAIQRNQKPFSKIDARSVLKKGRKGEKREGTSRLRQITPDFGHSPPSLLAARNAIR